MRKSIEFLSQPSTGQLLYRVVVDAAHGSNAGYTLALHEVFGPAAAPPPVRQRRPSSFSKSSPPAVDGDAAPLRFSSVTVSARTKRSMER
ncbi:MAG: hypothetical protein K0R38_3833 [Polyangiaceae bacterium]|jgi:hypothetical protein|nr:hypothetical protein [Polyangiaceae bacterium]